MGVRGQRNALVALPVGKRDVVQLYRRMCGALGPIWTVMENLPPTPPGFGQRTVQPVAHRPADNAAPVHKLDCPI